MTAGDPMNFVNDRLNNSNNSIYLKSSFCQMPNSTYFYANFTFLAWARLASNSRWARLIDCGRGRATWNFVVTMTYLNVSLPTLQMFNATSSMFVLNSTYRPSLNEWVHYAVVLDNNNALFYINGALQSVRPRTFPFQVTYRNSCFIGRSNWYPSDKDSDASYDEIRIYNRALDQSEIQNHMNFKKSFLNIY